MATINSYTEIFKTGKDFDQIYFLDNFYETIDVLNETEQTLSNILTSAIDNSLNVYVKRSAFKILCDLTLVKIITNNFTVLSLMHKLLFGVDSLLLSISLKYLPYFLSARTIDFEDRIKALSDDSNGEVASQAYFCLGLIQLTNGTSQNNITKSLITLHESKQYFQSAIQSVENRIDAEFYLLLIDCCESLINNNTQLVKTTFESLKKNILTRNLYEFDERNIELDFLFFQLTEQIKFSFETAVKAKTWLEIKPQIKILLDINIELKKIKDSTETNHFFIERLFSNVLENVGNRIYEVNLLSEKERLQSLLTDTKNSLIVDFINHIISLLPDTEIPQSENLELLSLLVKYDHDDGLRNYEQLSDKRISSEAINMIQKLLQKDYNNLMPFKTGSITGQEVLISLRSQIEVLLPDYPLNKLEIFFKVIEEVIRYARISFVGNDKKRFNFLFAESENGKGQNAIEQDLQDNMIVFFEHSNIADGLGHEQAKFVDGGRVDILYKKDIITIPIELKKSPIRPTQQILEENYIAQAQTYTAGYEQLGVFVLLELSDKSIEPPPNFKDWFRVHHLKPHTNLPIKFPDYIISVVIPGNRVLPSTRSTYN